MTRPIITGTEDLDIAARTVWGEGRGEPDPGRIAIAWVIRNRAERGGWWGDTVKAVCLKPYQFSAWNEGDPNRGKMQRLMTDAPDYRHCVAIVANVLVGAYPDPTERATHYHFKGMDWPAAWGEPREPSANIGNHLFYNTVR